MASFPKHLGELADDKLVLVYDLFRRTRNLLVVVVPCRVARPDDEIDVVLEMLIDPFECLIDQRKGRVTTGCLSAVDTSRTMPTVAGVTRAGTRIRLVEGIGVYV